MTTYTPQQAREMAGRAIDHGTTARALKSLADQVEALTNKLMMDDAIIVNNEADIRRLTAERNQQTEMVDKCILEISNLTSESDALKADAEKWRAREARNKALLDAGFLGSPLRSAS